MYKMLIIIVLFLCFCINNKAKQELAIKNGCNKNYYTEILKNRIEDFKPTQLNLDSSIINNKELKIFLDTVNIECLEEQRLYKEFITTILIKEYYFQLNNYNQSYDLLQMKNGNAKVIINGFMKLSGVDKNIEMLSSGYIMEYLKNNPEIKNKEIEYYQKLIFKDTH